MANIKRLKGVAQRSGQKAANVAAHRLRLKGCEVEVHVPPAAGDWLDVLVSEEGDVHGQS